MTLTIKEGGFYINRKGEKVGPMVSRLDYKYPWQATGGKVYTKRGFYFLGTEESEYDLIAEWTDPTAEPEWGEWTDGHVYSKDQDYQFQRINGVSQFRVRKAPPAPVVTTEPVIAYISTMNSEPIIRATVDLIDGKPDWSTLKAVTE